MKLWFVILALALVCVSPAYALNVEMSAAKTDFIYPKEKGTNVSIVLDRGFQEALFGVEDVDLTVSVSGPATIDGGNSVSYAKDDLKDDAFLSYVVDLKDTDSDSRETIVIQVTGQYVSNAWFGGGKKDVSESISLTVISTEKSKVIEEKRIAEQEKVQCEDSLSVCRAELANVRIALSDSEALVSSLTVDNAACEANLTALSSQKESVRCADDFVWILLIIFALLSLIFFVAMVFFKVKKDAAEARSHPKSQFHH